MQQNFSSTKLPTVGAATAPSNNGSDWQNPMRITVDDGSQATWAAAGMGGDHGATIAGSVFGFQQLPEKAVIDGIEVLLDGSEFSAYGSVLLNIPGSQSKPAGTFNTAYGGAGDLWGLDFIDPADIPGLVVSVIAGDVSGGDGTAGIDYMSVTVFWHIEVPNLPADVPTRVEYKVYNNEGQYLGLLPKVTSKFAFPLPF